jgi:hypothetical protein
VPSLTVSPSQSDPKWVYRIFDRRIVSVKSKNNEVRKVAVVDMLTNLPFAIEVPTEDLLKSLEIEKPYNVSLKTYTARDLTGVPQEFVEFFTVLDVDQSLEDFIKAYWLYPKLIKFELSEVEQA